MIHLMTSIDKIILKLTTNIIRWFNWSPPGGSTAAQRFWSKEVCDKERSLEEQSFEIWVFLEASVRILFSALSSAGSWILGFVLGKFLDFLGKVGWRPNQEQRKPSQERVGLEGRSPPSKSSRKHAQSKPRSSKNHPKIIDHRALTPQKSRPKGSWTVLKSRFVSRTALGELPRSFLELR